MVIAGNHLGLAITDKALRQYDILKNIYGNLSTMISQHQEEMRRARVRPASGASSAPGKELRKNFHSRGELFQI